jgi:hypothetical protein
LDIHFTVGTSCERAAPLAEKNAAARQHILRCLISLRNEHRVAQSLKSANNRSAAQEILVFYGTRNCRIHNSSSLVPIVSPFNPVHTLTPYNFKLYSNVNLPSTPLASKWLFSIAFSDQKIYKHLSSVPYVSHAHTSFILSR